MEVLLVVCLAANRLLDPRVIVHGDQPPYRPIRLRFCPAQGPAPVPRAHYSRVDQATTVPVVLTVVAPRPMCGSQLSGVCDRRFRWSHPVPRLLASPVGSKGFTFWRAIALRRPDWQGLAGPRQAGAGGRV